MPLYQYRVRDSEGREHRGSLESPSEADVIKVLKESNYYILDIKVERPEDSAAAKGGLEFFQQKITKSDVLILTRQLAAMAASGIPIMSILKSISEQVKKKRLKDIVLSLRSDVEEGQNLSEAMAKHPEAFSPF